MRILNAADVRKALPMRDAVEAMKQAFAALSAGRAEVPHRIHLPVARNAGLSLFMPAFLDDEDPSRQALAVKVVSLFDGNAARGLARIQAAVLALDPQTGRAEALLEGATLTAIRTAAASGAATDLLARPEARVVALFGAGVQARAHVEAMCAVRPIERIAIYSRTRSKVDALIAGVSGTTGVTAELVAAETPRAALREADIVCTVTTSATPVFEDSNLREGTHINAVGSYQPSVAEVPADTVVRARVFVDSRHAAGEEAGDLIQPRQAGRIGPDHIHAELGELVLGTRTGRSDERQITLFKSVGIAVQDAAAAHRALANARELGLGTEVAWL